MLCATAVIGVTIVMSSLWLAAAAGASGDWASYGEDLANSRSQSHPDGIGAATASRLHERFAIRRSGIAHGATPSVTSTPAVDGGVAYYGDWQGGLHAVNLASGRERWTTHVAVQDGPLAALNSSPAVVGNSVFVSTGDGRVVAVTRRTGKVRWATVLDTHFASTLYSSPAVAGNTLVVGVSSAQNFFAGPYDFRGSIVALDTRHGRTLWRTFVMRPDVDGTGGSVWSSAAIDRSRGVAYIGTGQAYAPPAGPLNDALLALRIRDGSLVWKRQFIADDVWTVFEPPGGKDYDIGAAPNLFRIGTRAVIGVGDKAGRYATLDRGDGRTIWRQALCRGSHLGGVMTTAAVARGSIWLACNRLSAAALDLAHPSATDRYFDNPGFADASSHTDILRLRASDGRTIWRHTVPGGTLGALTEAGGAVFVPNSNGMLRALDARSGRTLWTTRPGAPLGGGPTVANGLVLTGYGVQLGGPTRAFNPPPDARGGLVAYAPRP